jgi:hypothetical protein
VKLLITVSLIAAICLSATAATSVDKSRLFIGFDAALNFRKGAYEFDEYELKQDTARNTVITMGCSLGKRYVLSKMFRLNAGLIFNTGSVSEDTIYLPDYSCLIKNRFIHFGFSPEVVIILPQITNIIPYVFVGGGINYMHFDEKFYVLEDPSRPLQFTDGSGMEPHTSKRWSPHVNYGAGADIYLTRDIGISIRYDFRFWEPVKFDESRDFPAKAASYREIFLTHALQLQFLLALTGN